MDENWWNNSQLFKDCQCRRFRLSDRTCSYSLHCGWRVCLHRWLPRLLWGLQETPRTAICCEYTTHSVTLNISCLSEVTTNSWIYMHGQLCYTCNTLYMYFYTYNTHVAYTHVLYMWFYACNTHVCYRPVLHVLNICIMCSTMYYRNMKYICNTWKTQHMYIILMYYTYKKNRWTCPSVMKCVIKDKWIAQLFFSHNGTKQQTYVC